ncbi:hypothetical protein [Escherichia coli]|nr:hypothetical protein [Escherichia coli]
MAHWSIDFINPCPAVYRIGYKIAPSTNTLSSGILHKTKEVGVYTTVIVIAIALIVVQYQLASLKQKISDLKTENEALKNSIKDEKNKLSFTISDIEQSIEIIENNINRLKKEDIHEINDNIKDLKSWLRNVGQIATSTRDKLNPSMDD